jgi:hypothetical protein
MSSHLHPMVQALEAQVLANNTDPDAGLVALQSIKRAKLLQQANGSSSDAAAADGSIISDRDYVRALECGVLLAVQKQDLDLFQTNYQQAAGVAAASSNATAPPVRVSNLITGLQLLNLLVHNQASEFHSLLEILSSSSSDEENQVDVIQADPYIAFAVNLERKMMVGLYDQVLEQLQSPLEFLLVGDDDDSGLLQQQQQQQIRSCYAFFLQPLQRTLWEAVCDNFELSYTTLAVRAAADLLNMDVTEFVGYVEAERSVDDWLIENGTIEFVNNNNTFGGTNAATTVDASDIPAKEWIASTLTYATEMERII